MSLTEGYRVLDKRLRREGFRRCDDQYETPMTGDCAVWVLHRNLPAIQALGLYGFTENECVKTVRKVVAEGVRGLVENGKMVWPWQQDHMATWIKEMSTSGTFVDNIWLQVTLKRLPFAHVQAFALLAGPSLVVVPTLASSGSRPHGITVIHGTNTSMEPIFMGYMEDSIYTAGHFQVFQFQLVFFLKKTL